VTQRIRLILVLLFLATSAHAQPSPEPTSPVDPESALEPEPAPPEALESPAEPEPPVEFEEAEAPLPSPEGDGAIAPEDEIIITGTRIRAKSAFGNAAPVAVIDRKQLERSGAANVADALQYMTAAQGNATASLGAGGGAAGVNLRGLGAGATLLLVNGRRTNPSGTGPGVAFYSDISTIPLAAIERIEVMTTGAAAIYGADAVGGVVNVITRRNWSGGKVQAEGKTTSRTDLGEYTLSGSLGAVGERSRVLAAGSYFRRGELTADKRSFANGKFWGPQGYPGAFIPIATPAMGMVPAMPAGLVMPDAACGPASGTETTPALGGTSCKFDYRRYIALVAHGERANAFASGEFDITDHLVMFGEVMLSRFRGDNPLPIYLIGAPYPVVPANHVDNPYGRPVAYYGVPGGGRPTLGTVSTNSDDSLRGVVGLKGDFAGNTESYFESWAWELGVSIGISRFHRTTEDTLRDAFQLALNNCSDPKNLARCYNPFYSATDGTGTGNSQEVIDTFAGRQIETTDHSLQTYNAGLTGELLELPGGPLGMALGGEFRSEWRSSEWDHDTRQGRYAFSGLGKDRRANRNVYSGYLELRWPILSGLELQTAARLEYYDDTDATPISPSAGLSIVPSELIGREQTAGALRRLQFRGSASKSFRAPSIYNTYPGATTLGTALTVNKQPSYTPVTYIGSQTLEPEEAYTFSAGFTWTPLDALNLTADYWYYNYNNRIQVEAPQQLINTWEAAGMPPSPKIIVDPVTGSVGPVISSTINVEGSVITSGIDFGVTANLLDGGADQGAALSIGVQGTWTINYEVPPAEAQERTAPDGTKYKDCTGLTTEDHCDVAGNRNSATAAPALPRLKLNIPLFAGFGGHSLTATGHYISGYEDDIANPDMTYRMVDAWVTIDLQYAYSLRDIIGKELILRIGCANLLDRQPSYVNGVAAAYDVEVHEPRGRMLYADMSAEF
jgi:iron complex outermembrane recepter protein